MTESVNPKMGNQPVFPMGGVKSGATGDGEERITSLANVSVEAFDKEYMTSLEIAELTGKQHQHVMRDIRSILKQGVCESNFGLMLNIKELPNGGKREDPYYKLTKKGCLILASGYNAVLREKIINRWEELEKKERKQEQAKMQAEQMKPQQSFLQEKLTVADWMMNTLRYSDVARLQLVSSIAKPYGLPVPDYGPAPNGVKHSATELLKTHGVDMSARRFNELSAKAGLLEQKERKGTAKVHKFYSITDKGLPYGENDVNEKNANQTQPHWYDNKFGEVLEIIGCKPSGQTDMFASGEAHK